MFHVKQGEQLDIEEFRSRLVGVVGELDERLLAGLFCHYECLLRWNRRLSLVGPGAESELVERHFAESLLALPLVPPDVAVVVDVGSGGGFPGIPLAAALPDARHFLVEARERKWAFLKTALREAGIDASAVLGTIDRGLPDAVPEKIDLLTLRAVNLSMQAWNSLTPRLARGARVLIWAGADLPRVAPGLLQVDDLRLPGSEHRRIVALEQGPAELS
jgi:16S rRNA (guanine527-N7)-methyltransferase